MDRRWAPAGASEKGRKQMILHFGESTALYVARLNKLCRWASGLSEVGKTRSPCPHKRPIQNDVYSMKGCALPKQTWSLLTSLILLQSVTAWGRQSSPPPSSQWPVKPLTAVSQELVATVSPDKELAADAKVARGIDPLRFAVPSKVAMRPETHGTWEEVPGGRLWRLRVLAKGATDLNFGFTSFWLPPGATLHVCSERENYYQGPFTDQDNGSSGQLWTPVVPGDSAVIELFVPSQATVQPVLELARVNAGYRDLFGRGKSLTQAKSESCEINVVCPQGDPWRSEIRSVARFSVIGMYFCSGTMIMDAAADFRSYFLTANHCEATVGTAPSVVVYWNFQSPTCGVQGGGSLAQNQSGATFRAAKADVDFTLLELNQIPDPNFKVYYAGWDRSGVPAAGVVGIHHPNADEKVISFSSNALQTVDSCIGTGGSGTHWQVTWSAGVTEQGSSGSAIWDSTSHLILGTLSGGGSDCATPYSPDCYGKFSVAWDSGTDSQTRLRDWLDPFNSGVGSVTGQNPPPVLIVSDTATVVSGTCFPTNTSVNPGETVTVNFGLRNHGTLASTNLVATLLSANGVLFPGAPQTYGAIGTNTTVTRPFTFLASGTCGATINPTLDLWDGAAYLGQTRFSLTLGQFIPSWTENFDTVTEPALPAGWSTASSGAETPWQSSSTLSDTAPNSMFVAEAASIGESSLTSPTLAIPSEAVRLSFRHRYDVEDGYDGGILEIKIGGGAFTDILTAGGAFLTGGYDRSSARYSQIRSAVNPPGREAPAASSPPR
jgi:hypothetical protein